VLPLLLITILVIACLDQSEILHLKRFSLGGNTSLSMHAP
jgi:hypothetical protein